MDPMSKINIDQSSEKKIKKKNKKISQRKLACMLHAGWWSLFNVILAFQTFLF